MQRWACSAATKQAGGGWCSVPRRISVALFTTSEKGAKPVRLTGTIKKYGVDIGFTQNAVILWAVVSTSDKFTPGDLAGSYGGVTAEAAWAVGLGANVLLGGSKKGFALQPLSVQGYNGINLAAGVTEVELKPAM